MENQNTESKTTKKLFQNTYVKLTFSVLILFLGVISFLPNASVIRSFPLLIILSGISGLIYKDRAVLCGFSFILTFCMYCTSGSSIYSALFFSLLSSLFTLLGLLIFSRLNLIKKCAKKKSKSFYSKQAILFTIISLILYFTVCGNPYSAIVSNIENQNYINQNYKDVNVLYTSFSLADFDFHTFAEFKDEESIIGSDGTCFIMKTKNKIHDGIRDYAEEKMLFESRKVLSNILGNATDAYSILLSDIDFENGETISLNEKAKDYYARTKYVIGLYSIIEDKHSFERLAIDCIKTLKKAPDFDFQQITFCAGNASSALYSLKITPDTYESEVSLCIKDFEHSQDLLGISQKDFLSYWT